MKRVLLLMTALVACACPALASQEPGLAHQPLWLALPFAGVLLSIALGPLLAAHFWHRHYGKVALAWALALLIPLTWLIGLQATSQVLLHALLLEYLPFIVLLLTLFTLAGGIHLRGRLGGTPWSNTLMLAAGAGLASVIGTTGAAMVLVRPLISANATRPRNVHVMVFFIFLAANIGGALTPLGDPPLFLGFLRGVDFFWTLRNLWQPTLFCVVVLLALFAFIDSLAHRQEKAPLPAAAGEPAGLDGWVNIGLLVMAIGTIIAAAGWKSNAALNIFGVPVVIASLVRDGCLLLISLASIILTPQRIRQANGFEWEPIVEVAKLFGSIFVCIVPVLAMLQAGSSGPFAALLKLVTLPGGAPSNPAYFWSTGLLSAVLDNAPTYLVFFELAGGDPARLMGALAPTLAAISMGAVYMGALTYIGNAPNFMVYAIARRSGIKMPGFFGYLLWSLGILLPLFVVVNWVFIR